MVRTIKNMPRMRTIRLRRAGFLVQERPRFLAFILAVIAIDVGVALLEDMACEEECSIMIAKRQTDG